MRLLRRFSDDRRGAAAVEAALVVPVLAGVLIFGSEAFMLSRAQGDMRAGVDAAAQLAMTGSRDTAALRQAVLTAWKSKPADASATATRFCECGGTPAECRPCPDNTPPSIFFRFQARGTFESPVFGQTLQHTQVVRVR